jgi:hypothetical protein
MKNYFAYSSNGLYLHDILYGIDDRIKWSSDGLKMNVSKVRYEDHEDYADESVAYFNAYGRKVYLHDCLRVGAFR